MSARKVPLAPIAIRNTAITEARIFTINIYARHSAGCCWHIVLDDYNTTPSCIEYCIKERNTKHVDCAGLARVARSCRAPNGKS